jgi:hypothetical protein
MRSTDFYTEVGKKVVFAVSLDWPGWCRQGKTVEDALVEVENYRWRYQKIVPAMGPLGKISVVGTIKGDGTTDFGAPSVLGPWDKTPANSVDRLRHLEILSASWHYFDDVVKGAPATMKKGPRGGGRDRDAIVAHVQEAERTYGRKIGVRVPPRTPWPQQRKAIMNQFHSGVANAGWPQEYALRRMVWHIIDHAWEIEDKGS